LIVLELKKLKLKINLRILLFAIF